MVAAGQWHLFKIRFRNAFNTPSASESSRTIAGRFADPTAKPLPFGLDVRGKRSHRTADREVGPGKKRPSRQRPLSDSYNSLQSLSLSKLLASLYRG